MAKDFGQFPSSRLFPPGTNPNFTIWVDNLIWEIGKKDEYDIQGKRDELEAKNNLTMFEAIMKVLVAIAKRG